MTNRLLTAALAVATALVIVSSTAAVVHFHEGYIAIPATCCKDHQHYLAMSGGLPDQPRAASVRPFAYRLLSPAIVRALPLSSTAGFHVLTVVSLGVALLLFFYVIRSLGLGNGAATGGAILLGSLYWAVEWNQMDFALVDPLSFALFAAVLLALYRGASSGLVASLIALSVLNKEVGLLLIPVAIVVLIRERRCTLLRTAYLVLAPLGVFVLTRTFVTVHGDYDVMTVLRDSAMDRFGSGSAAWPEIESYLIPTWGPLLLIAGLQPQTLIRFARKFPELPLLFLLVHLQLLFATDTSRLLMMAYPAVILAIIYCMSESLRRGGLILSVALMAAVFQGVYFEFQRETVARFANARTSFDPDTLRFEIRMTIAMLALASLVALPAWWRTVKWLIRLLHAPPATDDGQEDALSAVPSQPL